MLPVSTLCFLLVVYLILNYWVKKSIKTRQNILPPADSPPEPFVGITNYTMPLVGITNYTIDYQADEVPRMTVELVAHDPDAFRVWLQRHTP